MRFPTYFKRSKGAVPAPTPAVLGTATDPIPTFATTSSKNKDNILSHRLSRPIERICVGYWFDPLVADAAVTLPVTLFAFDETSGKWFKVSSGTLTSGQMTYLQCPSLCDPPQTQANLNVPGHGIDVMICVADNAGGNGTYHFVAGPDSAFF